MQPDESDPRRLLAWFFRDRWTGRIVVGQWPNTPLWVFAAASAALFALDASGLAIAPLLREGLSWLARLGLAWWALDEVVRGVNPWRRCLGGAVLLLGLWSLAVQT